MSTQELETWIDFIIANDNTELAEGLRGLKTYIDYVACDGFCEAIKPFIWDDYLSLKEEIEGDKVPIEELPHNCVFVYNDLKLIKVGSEIFDYNGRDKEINPRTRVELFSTEVFC